MGVTQVTVTIRNPAEPERSWEGLFLHEEEELSRATKRRGEQIGFANRVLGENHTDAQEAELKEQLKTLLQQGSGLLKIIRPTTEQDMDEGFTRLDALNRIGNQLFFTDLLEAKEQGFSALNNLVPISAPVNYPHIWDTSWFSWVQYDASIMQPMVRNAGEALGVSARINLVDPQRTLFKSSVPVRTVYKMEQLLAGENPFSGERSFKGLQSPKWPEDIFGKLDEERKGRGKALYQQHCQQCHLPNEKGPGRIGKALSPDERWALIEFLKSL